MRGFQPARRGVHHPRRTGPRQRPHLAHRCQRRRPGSGSSRGHRGVDLPHGPGLGSQRSSGWPTVRQHGLRRDRRPGRGALRPVHDHVQRPCRRCRLQPQHHRQRSGQQRRAAELRRVADRRQRVAPAGLRGPRCQGRHDVGDVQRQGFPPRCHHRSGPAHPAGRGCRPQQPGCVHRDVRRCDRAGLVRHRRPLAEHQFGIGPGPRRAGARDARPRVHRAGHGHG